MHSLYALHDILGITGIGIEGHEAEHAANLEIGVDLMSLLHHKGCCHHLIVGSLIERLLGILKFRKTDAGIGPAENIDGRVGLVVDLIEGHPVFDLILVTLHDAKSIAYEEIHQFAVGPAAVLLCQIVGHLEVAECDDRLDAVLQELVKQIVIELQTLFIGLCLIALRENAAPGNRCAEALKAQLREQLYVLLISVEEVDALMVGIILPGHHAVGNTSRDLIGAARHHVADAGSSSVDIPRSLELVCGNCAAP